MVEYEKIPEYLKRQAEECGCWGLVRGYAKNVKTHKEFYAGFATKSDGPFYCKDCFSDAVIKKCTEKTDHFAHKARLSPVIPSGETALHRDCNRAICDLLANRFPDGNWATERPIPRNDALGVPELRPDISGRINNTRVAIEVQASSLTVPKIIARTEAYSKREIALLWIVPLIEELGSEIFRPRLYERYIHSIYYGRIYYWWSGLGLNLIPVHYGVAKRFIDYAEWYEGGELIEVGGYEKAYKIIKQPLYGHSAHIVDDFSCRERPGFTPDNERKAVPSGLIWMDKQEKWWPKEDPVATEATSDDSQRYTF